MIDIDDLASSVYSNARRLVENLARINWNHDFDQEELALSFSFYFKELIVNHKNPQIAQTALTITVDSIILKITGTGVLSITEKDKNLKTILDVLRDESFKNTFLQNAENIETVAGFVGKDRYGLDPKTIQAKNVFLRGVGGRVSKNMDQQEALEACKASRSVIHKK